MNTKRTTGRWGFLALAVTSLTLSACSKPPTVEMEAADAAMAAAVSAGAEEYASASMASARDLQAELTAELGIQADKSALTRSYDHATDLAIQLKAAADQTATEAASTKEQVRQEPTALLAEVKLALTEVQGMLATAPRGKGSATDLAAFQADLDSAAVTLAEGETAIAEGRYLDAKTKVLAVQSSTQSVKSAIETAARARTGR